jgi:hypothetical protein
MSDKVLIFLANSLTLLGVNSFAFILISADLTGATTNPFVGCSPVSRSTVNPSGLFLITLVISSAPNL